MEVNKKLVKTLRAVEKILRIDMPITADDLKTAADVLDRAEPDIVWVIYYRNHGTDEWGVHSVWFDTDTAHDALKNLRRGEVNNAREVVGRYVKTNYFISEQKIN